MPGALLGYRSEATHRFALLWWLAAWSTRNAGAFYIPGFSPNEYAQGSSVALKVNKLMSMKTQIPYDYYRLPYCRPQNVKEKIENLGETLMGEQVQNSPFQISVLKNATCNVLCKMTLSETHKEMFRNMIDDEYVVNMIIDNLPAATRIRGQDGKQFTYFDGFLVGFSALGKYYINNHITLDLKYHSDSSRYDGYRIVGFEVEPMSLTQAVRSDASAPQHFVAMCESGIAAPMFDLDQSEIVYTYDVIWTESDVRWASRWDTYLKLSGGEVHWFAILNSLVIMLMLSAVIAMIMLRTLYRDITKYNEVATKEDAMEETGWKLVHADVFRKPRFSWLYCVSVGSGVQILGMSVVTLIFALLGLISPQRRGALLQSTLLLFTFMGLPAGFVCSRYSKLFDGSAQHFKMTTVLTACLYPTLFFCVFFILNLCLWGAGSSGAVPFTTMCAILVLWFGVSVPLVALGAYSGFKRPDIELPTRVGAIPRGVPKHPWYARPALVSLMGGLLPFGAVYTELYFIMNSLWQHRFYYLFGFLGLVLVILILTCAEISIALTYMQLTSEDYRWWWTSFFAGGSSGMYLFLYSIVYYAQKLQLRHPVSTLMFFGYMGLLSIMFLLLTGAIGSLAAFWFVRAIYGSVKVD